MTFFQRVTTRVVGLYQVDALLELFMTLVRVAATDQNRRLIHHLGNGFVNYEVTHDRNFLPGKS